MHQCKKADQTCYTENVASGPRGRSMTLWFQESKEISNHVHAQFIIGLNNRPIRLGLQLDETTDVGNMSQLLVFFR